MDNQQIAIVIPVAHDAYVFILRVKHQISRLGLVPRDVGTVGVLGMGAPAVTNYILAAGGVVRPNPRIAIGNPLILSPGFPPLHTVREPFSSHGVPS